MKDIELLQFMNEIEEHYFVEAPKNFKESIMIQTSTLPVRAVHKVEKLSKNMQLFLYSMKVCTAVLAVLLFLNFSHTIDILNGGIRDYSMKNDKDFEITSVIVEKTMNVSGALRTLSDELLNLGGIFDD